MPELRHLLKSGTRRPTTDNRQPPPAAGSQSPTPCDRQHSHTAPYHRQPTASTSRRFPKSCDRQTAPAARRKIPAARLLRRQSAANHNHTRTSQPAAASPPHNSRQQKNGPDSHEESSNRFFRQGTTPIENEVQSEVFDPGTSTAPSVLAAVGPLQPADFLNQPKTTNLNEP